MWLRANNSRSSPLPPSPHPLITVAFLIFSRSHIVYISSRGGGLRGVGCYTTNQIVLNRALSSLCIITILTILTILTIRDNMRICSYPISHILTLISPIPYLTSQRGGTTIPTNPKPGKMHTLPSRNYLTHLTTLTYITQPQP